MIKEKIRNSLFLQLMIFAGCLILALFAGMILTLRYIGGTVRENIWSTNEKLTFQIETQMEENYLKMRNIATSIVYSPTVKKYLKQSETEKILHRNEIGSVFSNADLLEEDIKGISMYNASGKRIADYGMDISEIIGEETLLRDKMEYSNVCYLAETDIPYYLIYFPVFDLNNREYGQQIGMCIFLMKLDGLQQELEALKVTENTEIYLVDGDNRILKDGMEQKQLQIKMLTEDNRFYVNEQSVFMGKWKVLSRIPVSEVKGYKNSNIELFLLAYIFAILVVVALVYFFNKRILNRINAMERFIDANAGDSKLRMEVGEGDELGRVAVGLNQMLDDKERLNNENLESQKKMYEIELAGQQAQLMAYRNQINPHFLYNTFECICSMALYYDMEDIAEITMALSHIFRFSVKGDEIVKVEDELAYVEEYAKIIEYRFMGKIEVNIEADESVYQKRVIKLLLQPLIENAVFHGLEQQVEEGEVTVSVHMKDEGHLQFVVEDNGCGMETEKVRDLQESLQKRRKGNGVGMANIYQRLKLFYGADMKFEIESKIGEGTRIVIIIPDNLEERRNESV